MELVESTSVSEFVKKTLEQFGWQSGDPIPAELGPLLISIRETLPPSPRADVLIDIAAMPRDAIAQATNLLTEAKKVAAKNDEKRKKEEALSQLNPAAQKLMAIAESAPEIVDDRETEAAAPIAPPDSPSNDPPVEEAAESKTGLSPMAVLPFCPRCGWDMRQKFEIVPTELDKEDFLAAMLGGTKFQRDYELFGGKMRVVFHTILADENKLIHRQLVLDQGSKKIVTEAEWFVQMLEYRMALSLGAIVDKNGKPTAVIPSLGELPAVAGQSDLETLADYVNTKVLAHEVTRRLVGSHLRQFQRLVEALEAMALEPSFWNGIA